MPHALQPPDFLKSSAAATAPVIAAPNGALASGRLHLRWTETESDELMATALSAAREASASYADVRIGRYRSQNIGTRERQITGVSDSESSCTSSTSAPSIRAP